MGFGKKLAAAGFGKKFGVGGIRKKIRRRRDSEKKFGVGGIRKIKQNVAWSWKGQLTSSNPYLTVWFGVRRFVKVFGRPEQCSACAFRSPWGLDGCWRKLNSSFVQEVVGHEQTFMFAERCSMPVLKNWKNKKGWGCGRGGGVRMDIRSGFNLGHHLASVFHFGETSISNSSFSYSMSEL